MLTRRRTGLIAGIALCAAGFGLFGGAGYIHAKAWLAGGLLERAWGQRLNGAGPADTRPWPWADTAPLARLQVPRLEIDRIVLAGASGRTLAFGPAHLDGTAKPGDRGNSVITGHRDTHFQFLQDVEIGETLVVETIRGRKHLYKIVGIDVVDSRRGSLLLDTNRPMLSLVTCYPFDAEDPGGPMRYVVTAKMLF